MRHSIKGKEKAKPSGSISGTSQGTVAAARAKAEFLGLIEKVSTERRAITITKRGKPMVRIVPIDKRTTDDPFGCMKGSVQVKGDIVGPEPDVWEAMA